MTINHDFKKFPELTNSQMQTEYFNSPHIQLVEDFEATIVKVIDGDTVRLRIDRRDFAFPLRLLNLAAPELKEIGGKQSQKWLEQKLLKKFVEIKINPNNRVEKWGRLLGEIISEGFNINDESILTGHARDFNEKPIKTVPDFNKKLEANPWL